MMDELDKAVRFLKGIWPKVEGKNLEYAPYFVGNFTRSLHKENSPYCVYNNPICNEEEFEARAKELGWVNGFKWGKEYSVVNGEKPNLPGDVEIEPRILQYKTYGPKGKTGKFVWSRVTAFRIVDDRYKPFDETQPTNWHERGELPPVGVECEYGPYWHACEIVAYHKGLAVVWDAHDLEYFRTNKPEIFRPIKTDRDKFIEAAHAAIGCAGFGNDETASDYFEALFDAGFKAPQGDE